MRDRGASKNCERIFRNRTVKDCDELNAIWTQVDRAIRTVYRGASQNVYEPRVSHTGKIFH